VQPPDKFYRLVIPHIGMPTNYTIPVPTYGPTVLGLVLLCISTINMFIGDIGYPNYIMSFSSILFLIYAAYMTAPIALCNYDIYDEV